MGGPGGDQNLNNSGSSYRGNEPYNNPPMNQERTRSAIGMPQNMNQGGNPGGMPPGGMGPGGNPNIRPMGGMPGPGQGNPMGM